MTGIRLAGPPAAVAADAPQQPVYVYLTTSIADYVNQDITEERLHNALPMVERYRKQDPSAVATVYFSGAMSDYLARQNGQNRLLDFVQGFIARGVVQAGYDGSEEPTTSKHPMMDLSKTKTAEERWLLRLASAEQVLTEARDPMTGAPLPGKTGGLRRMQEVFGPAVAIRGVFLMFPNLYGPIVDVGIDTEIAHLIRKYNTTAIMQGLGDFDAAHTGSAYRGWTEVFSRHMSPDADTPPELFWQDEMLRASEASIRDLRLVRAMDGVDKVKAVLNALDRSRIRIVHVEIGSQRMYEKPAGPPKPGLVPPLRYAWSNPDKPQYPAELRTSAAHIETAYANEDAVMKYFVTEFFPANPGSRFVSSTQLKEMTPPGWGYELRMASLQAAVRDKLKSWGNNVTPPIDLHVDGHYLSDADMFAVLVDALAKMSGTGALPSSVNVSRVYGPMHTVEQNPPVSGEVTAGSVAKACVELAGPLQNDTWSPIPHNMIPSTVPIDGLNVNPAQFLHLMADALIAPSLATKLDIQPIGLFWGREAVFYKRRPMGEMGAAWTFKPAPVLLEKARTAERKSGE